MKMVFVMLVCGVLAMGCGHKQAAAPAPTTTPANAAPVNSPPPAQ